MLLNVYKQTFHISHVRISQKSKMCFNTKSSTYYFHMKTKLLTDFQICISVPLISHVDDLAHLNILSSSWHFCVYFWRTQALGCISPDSLTFDRYIFEKEG